VKQKLKLLNPNKLGHLLSSDNAMNAQILGVNSGDSDDDDVASPETVAKKGKKKQMMGVSSGQRKFNNFINER
jgi:hypothetical protein